MEDDGLQEKLFELICAMQKSDKNAFSEFYDLTVNRVYGLVFKIVGNKHDCEEVVCDLYTQIWQQTNNYSPKRGSILGWCLLIARCRALDLYRRRRTFKQVIKESQAFMQSVGDENAEPDKIIQLCQQNKQTQDAINQLSLVQRQLITLAFYKGLSHNEISVASGMPLGSVKSNIRRALESLQSKIKS